MNTSLKEKLILISFAALSALAVLNYTSLYSLVQTLLGSMTALFIGALIAFVLNVPMKKLEGLIEKVPFLQKSKRSLAIAGVLIGFVAIVTVLVVIVLPTLSSTISQLVNVTTKAIPKISDYLEDSGLLSSAMVSQVESYITDWTNLSNASQYVTGFLSGLVTNVSGLFSNFLTIVMAFFFTLSILSSKEQLQKMTLQVLFAVFPEKVVQRVAYVGHVIVETYDRFLMSQIVEAVIIGVLIFVSYSLCGMPYASMAGIITGVFSFVPYIGPLASCIISALFIAVQNPLLALGSLVLFQVIQLVEGNIIYPRVVGQSVGLPPLFTLSAALIGGNLFGLLGMVFFTPIFATLYRLIREWTQDQLEKKHLTIDA